VTNTTTTNNTAGRIEPESAYKGNWRFKIDGTVVLSVQYDNVCGSNARSEPSTPDYSATGSYGGKTYTGKVYIWRVKDPNNANGECYSGVYTRFKVFCDEQEVFSKGFGPTGPNSQKAYKDIAGDSSRSG
jgi:hypothetical protein